MTFPPEAGKCAAAVRSQFNLGRKPRTNELLDIVQRLGASISNVREGPIQAALGPVNECPDGSWRVSIDRSMASHRFRFALTHELGHLYLRHYGLETKLEERWCNEFAAEVLMPSEYISAEYHGAQYALATVKDLAYRYDVSRSAAIVRLRRVLGWKYGLIGLRLISQKWSVARMTAIPPVALYELEPTIKDTDIPRGCTTGQSWLRFGFRDEQIEILSEYERRGRWVDILVNSTDLAYTCSQIVRATTSR